MKCNFHRHNAVFLIPNPVFYKKPRFNQKKIVLKTSKTNGQLNQQPKNNFVCTAKKYRNPLAQLYFKIKII